jgi:hypothetical protein
MATYKGIKGFSIQNLSADPSNPIEGEMWYNSTSNVWKVEEATTAGAWATGGNMPTTYSENAGGGSKIAGIQFGGNSTGETNEYNGTWTSVNAMSNARNNHGGSGSQTAALAVGSQNIPPAPPSYSNLVEEYDGTSWTAGTNYPTTIASNPGLTGITTAAIMIGGAIPPYTSAVNNYDGTTWTAETALPSARDRNGVCGTQTTAISVGGRDPTAPPYLNTVDTYDGTSWTNVTNYPTGLQGIGTSGDSANAITFGGTIYAGPKQTATNIWNGSTFSSETAMSTARGQGSHGNVGSSTSSTFAAGESGSTATEEFTGAGAAVTKTITVS